MTNYVLDPNIVHNARGLPLEIGRRQVVDDWYCTFSVIYDPFETHGASVLGASGRFKMFASLRLEGVLIWRAQNVNCVDSALGKLMFGVNLCQTKL
jgi:hypothetical protein